MKQESQDIISRYMGVQPVMINSSLVSAQNRKRLYWTNIPFTMPEDRGIMLKDIIEDGLVDRDKAHCLDANYFKGGNLKSYFEKRRRQMVFNDHSCHQVGVADLNGHDILKRVYSPDGKSPTLNAHGGGNTEPKVIVDDILNFNENQETKISEINTTAEKSNCVTTAFGRGGSSKEYLTSVKKKTLALNEQNYWRKLTPLECERLQTVPDNYTEGVSNTQRYKMLGNGWTVDIIAHILKRLSD